MSTMDSIVAWAQILSVIIAIIAIVVTVWIYRLGKKIRSLGYTYSHVSKIESDWINGVSKEDSKIIYGGREIENIFLMDVRIKNTGNLPIRSSHVVTPLTFTFSPKSELLDMPKLLSSIPDELEVSWLFLKNDDHSKYNSISLNFELLDRDNSLWIEFVWTGENLPPKVSGHIEGIREFKRFEDKPRSIPLLEAIFIILFLGFFPLLLLAIRPSILALGIIIGFVYAGLIGFTSTQVRSARLHERALLHVGSMNYIEARKHYIWWLIFLVVLLLFPIGIFILNLLFQIN